MRLPTVHGCRVAAVELGRLRQASHDWAWIIFILLGIGKISINWATGEWTIVPLSIQLFSVPAFAAFNGPWIIAALPAIGCDHVHRADDAAPCGPRSRAGNKDGGVSGWHRQRATAGRFARIA
jgi:hypothetical protein